MVYLTYVDYLNENFNNGKRGRIIFIFDDDLDFWVNDIYRKFVQGERWP